MNKRANYKIVRQFFSKEAMKSPEVKELLLIDWKKRFLIEWTPPTADCYMADGRAYDSERCHPRARNGCHAGYCDLHWYMLKHGHRKGWMLGDELPGMTSNGYDARTY
jgi:hypothetical protein